MSALPKPYYEHAGITIYHGDCREIIDSLEFDVVVTDPPYGVEIDTGKLNRIGKPVDYEWHGVEHAGAHWLELITGRGCPAVLFGANFFADRLPAHGGWLIWDKQADGFKQGSPAELAWSNFLANIRMFRLNYRGFTTAGDPKRHPMQKPQKLMRWVLSLPEVDPAWTILDPFMGSGTTLRAAKDLGRKAIGIEIEEKYAEIAAKRLSQEVLPL